MSDRAKALVKGNAPWRRDVAWQVVGVEGLALLAVGLYIVVRPDQARDVTRALIGLALLLLSLQQIANSFRNPTHPFMPFQMLRGGIGATVGLLVALEPLVRSLTPEAARLILGAGLLVVGAIGLIGLLFTRSIEALHLESVITSTLTIAFGLVLLFGSTSGVNMLGWVALIGGLGLVVYAFILARGRRALHSG
ncbi:MAG: DUF308 domain-containing protein [Thermomicrobiales bacterium]|nr:DUF308 domain-containing protein [Thermomicrobiales bacterium]